MNPPSVSTLVHQLEVHQVEFEAQNLELVHANDELRRAHAAAAIAGDRYRALHELAPVPLITLAVDGEILDVNRAAEALLRAPRARLVGRQFGLFVAEATRAAVLGLLRTVVETGRVRAAELGLAFDDGVVEVAIDGVAVEDEGAARVVLAMVDVSSQRRAEELRRALDRRAAEVERLERLAALAAGIAHDFNNLLAVVVGGVDHVLRGGGLAPSSAEVLTEVVGAARRAGARADQMRAYAGQVSGPVGQLAVDELVHGLLPRMETSALTVPVRLEVAEDLPAVIGDAEQLEQVLLDLVANAAEAMRGRAGAIVVAARAVDRPTMLPATSVEPVLAAGRYVELEVRDQGHGMEASTLARIFDPYFSTRWIGRGLGLAVVQGVVRAHGGGIGVTSAPEAGATVRVYLPVGRSVPAAVVVRAASAPVVPATGLVLVVDDDTLVRRASVRAIKQLGFTAIDAASGAAALTIFAAAEAPVALVLMDLSMPGLDGVATARSIHVLAPAVPIVLVTGYGETTAAASHHFVGVLRKPFTVAELQAAIGRALPAGLTA